MVGYPIDLPVLFTIQNSIFQLFPDMFKVPQFLDMPKHGINLGVGIERFDLQKPVIDVLMYIEKLDPRIEILCLVVLRLRGHP